MQCKNCNGNLIIFEELAWHNNTVFECQNPKCGTFWAVFILNENFTMNGFKRFHQKRKRKLPIGEIHFVELEPMVTRLNTKRKPDKPREYPKI